MENLSVVVITRDHLPKLSRCLDSVRKVLPGAEIVVVVDNHPKADVCEYLEKSLDIVHVFVQKSLNVASARNVGLQKCTREFIMILDDDAWLERLDWFEIKKYLHLNPLVGIIVPKLLYPDGRLQESIRSFPGIPFVLWRGSRLYKVMPNVPWYSDQISHNETKLHKVDWGIGACQIIRADIFKKVGLLDGKLFAYEDADLCRRAKKFGYSTVYWPEAIIYHEYSRLSSKGINIRTFKHLLSTARFLMKK